MCIANNYSGYRGSFSQILIDKKDIKILKGPSLKKINVFMTYYFCQLVIELSIGDAVLNLLTPSGNCPTYVV